MNNVEISFFHYSFRRADRVERLERMTLAYIDLTYCVEGEMRYIYEGEEYTLYPGDAILYPKGSLRIRRGGDTAARYASFNVGYSGDFEPEVRGVIRKSVRSDTVAILESVRKCHLSLSEHKNERCAALFWSLYYQLIDTARENENPHIKHIKRYIADHLTEKINLSDIAEAVHLVPHYCCSLFSKLEGVSVFDFINAQRVELSKNLIASGTSSLSEVAEQVGFEDYNYFARTFKRVTGMTPSEYASSVKSISNA